MSVFESLDRAKQLEITDAALKRLKELRESILSDNTDYWDDRCLGVLKELKYLQGEDSKMPLREPPKWDIGTKVRIKDKGISYNPQEYDIIIHYEFNMLERGKGEYTYSLQQRDGHWKETELEEFNGSFPTFSPGDYVRILKSDYRYYTGTIVKELPFDGYTHQWLVRFDSVPRIDGLEEEEDWEMGFTYDEIEKI